MQIHDSETMQAIVEAIFAAGVPIAREHGVALVVVVVDGAESVQYRTMMGPTTTAGALTRAAGVYDAARVGAAPRYQSDAEIRAAAGAGGSAASVSTSEGGTAGGGNGAGEGGRAATARGLSPRDLDAVRSTGFAPDGIAAALGDETTRQRMRAGALADAINERRVAATDSASRAAVRRLDLTFVAAITLDRELPESAHVCDAPDIDPALPLAIVRAIVADERADRDGPNVSGAFVAWALRGAFAGHHARHAHGGSIGAFGREYEPLDEPARAAWAVGFRLAIEGEAS